MAISTHFHLPKLRERNCLAFYILATLCTSIEGAANCKSYHRYATAAGATDKAKLHHDAVILVKHEVFYFMLNNT